MIEPVTKARVIHVQLSPLELKLWRFINAEPCTMEQMIAHLYGDNLDGGPLYARNVIRSCLSRMNSKLLQHRIVCQNELYQVIIPERRYFPKSTRRRQPVSLTPLPWNKPQ